LVGYGWSLSEDQQVLGRGVFWEYWFLTTGIVLGEREVVPFEGFSSCNSEPQ